MFGKLLKYEFKSLSKWYFGLLFITTLVAIAAGNTFNQFINAVEDESSAYYSDQFMTSDIAFLISIILLGGLIIAVTIATYVIIIRRFYTSVFSRQGYLTMTLPVSAHQVILSKLSVAFLLFVVNYLILFIIGAAFIIPSVGIDSLMEYLSELFSELLPYVTPFWIIVWVLNSLFTNISAVLLIYLAIAIGQLFRERRILMGFVSYGALLIVSMIVSVLMTTTLSDTGLVLGDFIWTIVTLILAYFATHHIMTHNLNLE